MRNQQPGIALVFLTLLFVSACTSTKKSEPSKLDAPKIQKIKKLESPISAKSPHQRPLPADEGAFDDDRFQLKTDYSKWKLIDDQKSIRTYEKTVSNNGLVAFRGEVMIAAPLKRVATILVHQPHQKEWVHNYVKGYNVAEINDLEYIQYSETKVPWPFQNRDFVFRANVMIDRDPATLLIAMKSEEHPSAPPIEGIVRGEMIHSYYYLKEQPDGMHTRMVVEMEVNPKGEIPLWLVNLSQRGWPHQTLFSIRKMAARKDLKILKKIEEYFGKSGSKGGV